MRTRLSSTLLSISLVVGGAASAATARDLSGVVVDDSGRAVPRAYVRALDSGGRELAAVFADESGRFQVSVDTGDCRVEAALTGFAPGTARCDEAQPLRLTLRVAPLAETVIVTATFIPLEVVHAVRHASAGSIAGIAVNVAIVVYLVVRQLRHRKHGGA